MPVRRLIKLAAGMRPMVCSPDTVRWSPLDEALKNAESSSQFARQERTVSAYFSDMKLGKLRQNSPVSQDQELNSELEDFKDRVESLGGATYAS